jgi:L-seryl-tRNA(Ser) seleniumtransferase
MRDNPLRRALRCDKLTLAGLEATVRLYRTAPDLVAALPTLRWLTRSIADMDAIASAAVPLLQVRLGPGYDVQVVDAESEIGSGAQPTEALPSRAIAITHATVAPLAIAARFRAADPPIIGRVHAEQFLLDLRCIAAAAELVPNRWERDHGA